MSTITRERFKELQVWLGELTKDELFQVECLSRKMFTRAIMAGFTRGAKVTFVHKGELMEGVVTRVNKKTVGVLCGKHDEWKVTPSLLSIVE
tara:strand:+ start:82 stop:357 length:276 start_codon:yes stop_codon:yes gene_type:complete